MNKSSREINTNKQPISYKTSNPRLILFFFEIYDLEYAYVYIISTYFTKLSTVTNLIYCMS